MVHSFRPVRFHERTAVDDGSVGVSGASFTYSGTTQYAYLDQNGAWQAASSPSSNTAYFGVGQTTNWSIVRAAGHASPSNAEAYGQRGSAGRPTSADSGTDIVRLPPVTQLQVQRTAASGRRRAAATVTRPAAAR